MSSLQIIAILSPEFLEIMTVILLQSPKLVTSQHLLSLQNRKINRT